MARATLPRALELMFGHEGGYSNVATDSGGPTKYGITHATLAAHRGVASVTAEQVKALTLKEATEIYKAGYWTQSGGDLLPVGLDYAAFDFGVNSGPARAVKTLQTLVGVPADGNAGPQTLAAVEAYPSGPIQLIRDYCEARMAYLRSIKNAKTGFPKNGRGWTIRVTGIDPKGLYAPAPGVVGNALALAQAKPVVVTDPAPVGGDAKAVPPAPNPWVKPEVLGPIGATLPGVAALVAGPGPLQWAFAFGVVVMILIGAVYAFRRIARTPA
jgi:lysozyme family protein